MRCQRIGRVPIVTMGLGTSSAYPLSRMPAPPQKRTTFITHLCSIDGDFRNGHDEAAIPLSYELQLLHDFVLQVPGQDHDIVWLGLANPVRMINRNVRAWQESPLLV